MAEEFRGFYHSGHKNRTGNGLKASPDSEWKIILVLTLADASAHAPGSRATGETANLVSESEILPGLKDVGRVGAARNRGKLARTTSEQGQ